MSASQGAPRATAEAGDDGVWPLSLGYKSHCSAALGCGLLTLGTVRRRVSEETRIKVWRGSHGEKPPGQPCEEAILEVDSAGPAEPSDEPAAPAGTLSRQASNGLPLKPCDSKQSYCCFQPLHLGVTCYTAVDI